MQLSMMAIERMVNLGCEEIMLETEVINTGALVLYEKLGFMKDDRMSKYYLNGGDAFRLRLWIDNPLPRPGHENNVSVEHPEQANDAAATTGDAAAAEGGDGDMLPSEKAAAGKGGKSSSTSHGSKKKKGGKRK